MFIAHLNIGSNIGDSRSTIERAVAAVFAISCPTPSNAPRLPRLPRRSSFVESEPWGFESANKFLNIGVEILTDLYPLDLLNKIQSIEQSISPLSHRNPDGSYRDRFIDLDIIFLFPADSASALMPASRNEPEEWINNLFKQTFQYNHPLLTLPHPRALQRDFVTTPILELWNQNPLLRP